MKRHWTSDSAKDFLYRISFDFVTQLEGMMESDGVKPVELAKRLGVSKGRVSQILNNPGNITLKTAVEYARALNVKVAIVAYDDGDTSNDDGPVNPQIFATCWEKAGRPTDFFTAGMATALTRGFDLDLKRWRCRIEADAFTKSDALAVETTLIRTAPHVWWGEQDACFEATT